MFSNSRLRLGLPDQQSPWQGCDAIRAGCENGGDDEAHSLSTRPGRASQNFQRRLNAAPAANITGSGACSVRRADSVATPGC
jgi:hypothetical protein